MHVQRTALLEGRRRNRDDPSPAGRDHVREHRLHAVERAVEVDREYAVPRFAGDLAEGLPPGDRGRRHEDLDGPELPPNRRHRVVDRPAIGDVHGAGQRGNTT